MATKCNVRRNIVCNNCGKVGHIQKACHSYKPPLKSARSYSPNAKVSTGIEIAFRATNLLQ